MAEDNLFASLMIVVAIDIMLFLGQIAMHDINPENKQDFLMGNTPLHDGYINSTYGLNTSARLPELTQGVDPDTGLTFIDAIKTGAEWVKTLGGVIVGIVAAPYFFLVAILPVGFGAFSAAVGFIWVVSTIYLISKFILGR